MAGGIAAVCNGLGIFFAVVFLPDLLADRASHSLGPALIGVGFGLCWLLGIVALIWWLKLKYQSAELHVMRRSVTLKRRLLGFRRQITAMLPASPGASLVLDHEANGKPIMAVELNDTTPRIRFGLSLSTPENEWIVRTLNDFLGK